MNGLRTSAILLKVILPVYVIVTILNHTPVMNWLAGFFEPAMNLAGLPGEAAVVFTAGALINIYVALGILVALNLDPYQVTTLAIMCNICHELPVETAILKKTGVTVWPLLLLRLVGAMAAGVAFSAARPFFG